MKRRAFTWATLPAILVAVMMLSPVLWMLLTSFKLPPDTVAMPPRFLPGDMAPENSFWFRGTLGNYRHVFGDGDSVGPILNSLWVAFWATLVSLLTGSMAGYALSRFAFRGVHFVQWLILGTRLLPPLAVAVPVSFLFSRVGLQDTRFGLILLYSALNLSLSTWMMKGFFDEVPRAFEEAAFIDGYTRLEAFFKVVLPQVIPGLTATSVLGFLGAWNEYAFALTLTSIDAVTLPVRVHAISADSSSVTWGPLAAAALVSILPPVLFTFFTRRYLLRGITLGTVKE